MTARTIDGKALAARTVERTDFLSLLLREPFQAGPGLALLHGHLFEAVHRSLDGADPVRARPAEVTVVDEHAADCSRILLVQQQLELLLAAIDVGCPQLGGERIALLEQDAFVALSFRPQSSQPQVTRADVASDRGQPAGGLADLRLGLAELHGHAVTTPQVLANRLLQRADLLADTRQVLLGVAPVRMAGARQEHEQQKQGETLHEHGSRAREAEMVPGASA